MLRVFQVAICGEKAYVTEYRKARTDVERKQVIISYIRKKLCEHRELDNSSAQTRYIQNKARWLKNLINTREVFSIVDEAVQEVLKKSTPSEFEQARHLSSSPPPPSYVECVQIQKPADIIEHPPGLTYEKLQRLTSIGKRYNTEFSRDALTDLSQFSQMGYDIVIVADDSKSNEIRDVKDQFGQVQRRWDEQRQRMSILVEIAEILDSDGRLDVYPLNQPEMLDQTAREVQQWYARTEPLAELTPIRSVIKRVITDKRRKGKRAVILVAIDGSPTDYISDIASPGYVPNPKYIRRGDDGSMVNCDPAVNPIPHLRKLLATRDTDGSEFAVAYAAEQFPIGIIACTGDDKTMEYLNEWDRQIPFVDVVDDFDSERKECATYGCNLTMGDYIVKCLVGSVLAKYDRCDENPRSRKRHSAIY